jgi:hypothetical protein
MRNRFYPTLSALHEDPPNLPDAGFFEKQILVWNGYEGASGVPSFRNTGVRAYSQEVIQAARIQILAALALGGVAGYMIGKRRR